MQEAADAATRGDVHNTGGIDLDAEEPLHSAGTLTQTAADDDEMPF